MNEVLLKVPEDQITAGQITHALTALWPVHAHLVVPNCCMCGWEADLLVLRKSGYMEEVEIKVTRSDFLRDFTDKEHKHRTLLHGRPAYVPGGAYGSSSYDFSNVQPHIIKHFWYAMPRALAEKLSDQIPAYAGLIWVTPGHYGLTVHVQKKAPKLNCRKVTDAERIDLLESTYYRYWQMKRAHK